MAKEFAKIEEKYQEKEKEDYEDISFNLDSLSKYCIDRNNLTEDSIFDLFKDFKYIIPQGSIMSMLGHPTKIGSLSNCFVVGQPYDSYGGIMQKDQQLTQLMKRRGGVGIDISTLRPDSTVVSNSAGSSTGAVSFMDRFSNTTREVAQKGRRGALMITIDVRHPDVFDFVNVKKDRTRVTGANISVNLRDDFMKAVENDEDYILRFPCDNEFNPEFTQTLVDRLPYNELITESFAVNNPNESQKVYYKKIKAKELYDSIVENAWENAEPGQMFIDRHWDYSPDSVYSQFRMVTTNPCFHPDTLIETEYGRIKIKDIDKPMRVYSMDSDGKLIMSNASSSFISKKNAKTLKITLKNGSSIQVTPEHKLFVQDIGWFEAKDLKIGNQLGHLCRNRRGAKYAGVHLTTSPNKQKDQIMEHKLVYGQHELGMNVHHLDRNTYNNSIDNLELLSHSEHSRITALEDNPQTHQERGETGKFISGENSNYGKKTIIDLPENLKTNILSKSHNWIVSIEEGETIDVWDIQVEDTHCLIANNIVAHNCGEIGMGAYDACRLMALNFYSFVNNPFTPDATINYKLLYEVAYEQQRLADDLVDLELEHIDRILEKIESDPEPYSIKEPEIDLWENIKKVAMSGRRTGCGFTALGDMLAAIGVKYDSQQGKDIIDTVMRVKMLGELDCTIDLSILRGTFDGWDMHKEFEVIGDEGYPTIGSNDFYEMLYIEFPEQTKRMARYGRRNVSWNTVAPTGSVSILTQTTSGLEPLFMPYYMRRKKVNPGEEGVRVDFTDQNGDNWMEYPVMHSKFIEWYKELLNEEVEGGKETYSYVQVQSLLEIVEKEQLERIFKKSPWFGSTANDIDWISRVEIQAIIQKYTTHSISSTINLPNDVTKEEVSNIYMESYKQGLKGVTIYRDGCRTGVLISGNESKNKDFDYKDAPKRPQTLPCVTHKTSYKGEDWLVIVGIYNDKPYEVFCVKNEFNITGNNIEGELTKTKKSGYKLTLTDLFEIEEIVSDMTDEQKALTRMISTSLRHGANIKFVVEQLNKVEGTITSFTKAIARVLKRYIPEGEKSTVKELDDCTSPGECNIVFEEGCLTCKTCGNGKC